MCATTYAEELHAEAMQRLDDAIARRAAVFGVDRRSSALTMDRFAQAFAIQRPQRVTVQIRKLGVVHCGVPVDFFEPKDGGDVFYKVATQIGDLWGSAANVRQCSGVDGGCACAGEAGTCGGGADGGERSETAAVTALQVVPLGNTGNTTSAGGAR